MSVASKLASEVELIELRYVLELIEKFPIEMVLIQLRERVEVLESK